MTRYAMAIDLDRCVGCGACVVACRAEWGGARTWVTPIGPVGTYPDALESTFYVGQCQHCERPACVAACPTGAMARGPGGRVLVDATLCIGCRYCVAACPYGACAIDPRTGKADKCDLCLGRLAAGAAEPACVQTCIAAAKRFGDLDDPASAVSLALAGREARTLVTPGLDPGPRVLYLGAAHHSRLILAHCPPTRPAPERAQIAALGGPLLGGTAALLALYHWRHGPQRVPVGGPGGPPVPRYTLAQRRLHWLLATLTLALVLTGLTLLYGRAPLTALVGPYGFAMVASAAKEWHNLFGPLFGVALLTLGLGWWRDNRPAPGDWAWLLRGGGLFGPAPPWAGRFAAGQKLYFWVNLALGLTLLLSGLLLGFPLFGQGRVAMALAHALHLAAALPFVALLMGHLYLGGGGALPGMTSGSVDPDWARAYHPGWYGQVRGRADREGGDPRGEGP